MLHLAPHILLTSTRMKPLLNPFPIFTFLFTCLILINNPTCLYADNGQYTRCINTFSCGSITDLTYPFWGGNRGRDCGEPNLEITCDNGVPKFTVDSVTYRILIWNIKTQNLTVAREDYWGSSLCSNDYKNNTLDDTVFQYDDGSAVNITLLYNCNNNVIPPSSYYTPLQGCDQVYVSGGQNMPYVGSCKSVVIPVSTADAAALGATIGNPNVIQGVLQQGIGLKWTQSFDECHKCNGAGGACGYDDKGLTCFCKDGSSSQTSCPASGSSSNWKIITGVASAAACGVVLGVIIYYNRKKNSSLAQGRLVFKKTGTSTNHNIEDFIKNYSLLAQKRYSYSQVKRITNSFRDKLGQGGYGVVYKGSLPDGRHVAVKMISESKGSGEEFINEVASISRTSHVNIVSLFGFCSEMDKRALIYEFMPNGSLDKFLYKQGSPNAICDMDWNTLYQITISIARGLEYLHRGCSTRILHLDIKPQNILLDEDFCPKIADFGLAKICKKNESIVSILGTRGTPGYIAPEVFSRTFGGVSQKSDVYSYGMLILEVVGGRKNYDNQGSNTSELYFPDWIYKDLEQGNIPTSCLVDTKEENDMVMKITLVSLWCIQIKPSDRPSMSKVVEMLEGPLQSVPYPPKPVLNSPQKSLLEFPDISYDSSISEQIQ